jgi:hypothetical protein
MNPIVTQMMRNNPMTDMFQQVFGAMNGAQNPIAGLESMAVNDERMQTVLNTIRQNGGIQQAVYAEAQKRNMNPNDALNQAQQLLQAFTSR